MTQNHNSSQTALIHYDSMYCCATYLRKQKQHSDDVISHSDDVITAMRRNKVKVLSTLYGKPFITI